MELISVLDNVIYLDIETTGLDPFDNEIIEIGIIKVKDNKVSRYSSLIRPKGDVPVSIYNLCIGLTKEDLLSAKEFSELKDEIIAFLEELPIICHNGSFVKLFLNQYVPRITNKILNSMELAAILEPGRKSFDMQDLIKEVTTLKRSEVHRALEDATSIMYVVNSLLCRLWESEEILKGKEVTLYKFLKKEFPKNNRWNWTEYLQRPAMFSFEDFSYVYFEDTKKNSNKYKKVDIDYLKFERLLQEAEIWNNGGDINYQYREDQEKISRKIRENIEKEGRIFIEAPTGSGKTFAYVLVAAILAYINKKNKKKDDSSFIISTDTKELQNQLIDRDIPNILRKLNLHNKIKFGAMKGKGNYLCIERLEKCKDFEIDINGILSYVFLKRLGKDGKYGDLENINYWAATHFNVEKYKQFINCDSENCSLEKCNKPCYLRNRYNELPQDNITVVNHSLLASWPYTEKKQITHLILDEAHNLMEKAYDFFTDEFNSYDFLELLKEIDAAHGSILFLLDRLNGLYNFRVHIDKSAIKERKKEVELNIYNFLNELIRCGVSNEQYNFTEEFFNPEYKNKELVESMVEPLSVLKRSIFSLFKEIDNYIKEIVFDDEKDNGNEYKALISYTGKIKAAFDIIDNFITFTKEYAKILEVHKEFNYFIIKNTPLNIGQLINENILKEVKSTAFVSATLRINNSFNDAKKILGQERAESFNIPAVFHLEKRTKIFNAKDIGSYKSGDSYIKNTAKFIFDVAIKLRGHTLMLFNNNFRRDEVQKELEMLVKGTSLEIFTSKKAIPYLLDKNRQIIILGSKGFFEGIDVPGDALNCVIIDKIPNINPTEPLFKALREYNNIYYKEYNYPKLCIKMKQSYGRLIRSTLDYGYFIILDGGTNKETLRLLERDLGGPIIEERWSKEILNYIDKDYPRWQRENLIKLVSEINKNNIEDEFKNKVIKSNMFWEIQYHNKEKGEIIFANKDFRLKYNNSK